MSQPTRAPRPRHAIAWAVVTVLIVAPFVAMLWVPSYARTAPNAGGFPFFYWYQLVWVPGVAVLSVLAYLIMPRRRRGGGSRQPLGDGYGQPPPGGWYGQPPGTPPGSAGGSQDRPGTTSGTEATS